MAEHVTGVILAGGQGRRLSGRDKGLIVWRDRPLAAHVRDALTPQVDTVVISANRNLEAYAALGCRVMPDLRAGCPGPLGGVATALAAVAPGWVQFVPCDAPQPPRDLVARLAEGAHAPARMPHDGDRHQPAHALVATHLAAAAEDTLSRGARGLQAWLARMGAVAVDCRDVASGFRNINTPADLERLHQDPD